MRKKRMRQRDKESECVYVCVCMCAWKRERKWVREREREREWERERERGWRKRKTPSKDVWGMDYFIRIKAGTSFCMKSKSIFCVVITSYQIESHMCNWKISALWEFALSIEIFLSLAPPEGTELWNVRKKKIERWASFLSREIYLSIYLWCAYKYLTYFYAQVGHLGWCNG